MGGMVLGWENRLTRLVTFYAKTTHPGDPFFLYDADPPETPNWPQDLPPSPDLERVYRICGSGRFGGIDRLLCLSEAAVWTARYLESGRDYDSRGDVLKPGVHIVFAMDADGTPWILDVVSGRVASFYFKGGDWQEPSFPSFDSFMEHMLAEDLHSQDWGVAVRGILEDGA